MKRENIGWMLFALFAGLLVWFLTRKKTTASVSVNAVPLWNSHTDPGPPSATSAPPFQDAAGNLVCAAGYSLWQDSATGNYACYKNPITQVNTIDIQPGMPIIQQVPLQPVPTFDQLPTDTDGNIFTGTLTDNNGNPIPGGT